jgi:hypothetical protein
VTRGRGWASVRGPAAALILTAERLGWWAHSATIITTHDGSRLDLSLLNPCEVKDAVYAAVPGGASTGSVSQASARTLGAAWNLTSVRFPRSSRPPLPHVGWTEGLRAALRSAFCGRQWPQHRLWQAGMVVDNRCRPCHPDYGFDGDGSPGTLWHRIFDCPATAQLRRTSMPADTLAKTG